MTEGDVTLGDATPERWAKAHRRFLLAAVAAVADRLLGADPAPERTAVVDAAWPEDLGPNALDRLREIFGLSSFECQVLLLCAGVELDDRLAKHLEPRGGPTFGLALESLPEADWNALRPESPLRYWQLIDLAQGTVLTTRRLSIDERVLHYLLGLDSHDAELLELVDWLDDAAEELVPSHQGHAARMAATWQQAARQGEELPVFQLSGREGEAKRAVVLAAAELLGLEVLGLYAPALPDAGPDLRRFLRRLRREAAIFPFLLWLDNDAAALEEESLAAVSETIEAIPVPLVLTLRERASWSRRTALSIDLSKPSGAEQRDLWRRELGPWGDGLREAVARLTGHFSLGPAAIRAVCASALGPLLSDRAEPSADAVAEELWRACRAHSRPRLDALAERIELAVGWDDLVLPEGPRRLLQEVCQQMRYRPLVYDSWGFGARGNRGLGIAALFAGPSGTGKTLAAEIIAGELDLELYRIDLSAVVSKYIGETEKNLERVFDLAEAAGAVLLFDEADALFGKRTEVQDSKDRYANLEVSYLLQRMESYRGLTILTSNLKDAVDPAFLRRFRFIVEFPFPDSAQRLDLWRCILPAETPREGFDPGLLARFQLTGAGIRNAALGAAFFAAEAGRSVSHEDFVRATRRELLKLGQALPGIES